MDQELIAFLEIRFERIDKRFEQIDGRFEQMDKRFEQIDGRFERMDRRFEQIDGRFEHVDKRFEQMDRRFERVEETTRHIQVTVEALRGDVRQVAEGVIGGSERIDRLREKIEGRSDDDDLRKLLEASYRTLDQRIGHVEAWRATQGRDPVEVVRERWGKPPGPSSQT